MRGHASGQADLFVKISLEELVPKDHPLRAIKWMADGALAALSRRAIHEPHPHFVSAPAKV